MKRVNLPQNENETGSVDATDLQEKMRMIDVKSSSPTSLLAKNTLLLPSGVVYVKQLSNVSSTSDTGSSTKSSGSATGNPRNKTALAPGHSVMDWIRLGNSGVDLTGVGGIPRTVTLTELANHNKQNDAWIAIRGIVFNVTRYMDFHPGGIDELMKGVGKDATKLFDNVHAWVNYQSLLQKCVVGRLSRPSTSNLSKANEKSSIANDLLKSCTTQRKNEEEIGFDLSKMKMDWRQTSNTITLFYQTINDYQGIYYRISRINDAKLVFNLSFEKDIVIHELELAGEIEWPPAWNRNYESMEVDFTFRKKDKTLWKTQGNHTLSREPITNKRTYKEYEVLSNTSLCKLVHLLVLRAKDSLELIPIGRHLEAKIKVAGVEISRYYTPVPACLHPEDMAPNYTSDCICLMIKQYEDGALSPSITALNAKEKLTLSNGLGVFVVESFDRYSVVHMLAAGTGLTAMLGIIQRCLARRNVKSINLANFNKDEDNMFYVEQLERACKANKLKVTHILSQPSDSWKGRRGTISDELLNELIGNCSPHSCVFVCGPKGFLLSSRKCLRNLDWKAYQMYEFDD
ncbi:cytochrome b5 reductase 4 isoform X1 [Vespa velutina]|uniref:cytochrome b5 reductase 4 isoform X1 n=2 Tax=Vespa velutina TaxID=202808 RepID=UPI001FB42D6E|nr:cytochrome b5 reductase 4 isoform X1 [Vespa velutina]XP_047368678.1 cytochrome b5 reductase 4 isoform X1 [Vespa velutina]XP_047368679.1 cytochrome b5 reductase 4 isoform X1 [Vespa velutina]XP_047368680.1 cytochrome b5 reductase 4 isoform X1 [Vespa velutina]XP_047368681.1 cytochrome b5 reductase 4 isoform X1 [Vespa velutina]